MLNSISIHRSILIAAVAVAGVLVPHVARGQAAGTTDAADIETSKYTFAGVINANGTLVRSGPSENDYAVMKLDTGAKLAVVGMRFDWLKVAPPPGAFCLVAQAFVEKRGDGTLGRITNNPATVRIGSQLAPAMHRVPMRLDVGADVKILGEYNSEFYKIEPPAGVFLFVDKRFVTPEARVAAVSTPAVGTPDAGTPGAGTPGIGTPAVGTITLTTPTGTAPDIMAAGTIPETSLTNSTLNSGTGITVTSQTALTGRDTTQIETVSPPTAESFHVTSDGTSTQTPDPRASQSNLSAPATPAGSTGVELSGSPADGTTFTASSLDNPKPAEGVTELQKKLAGLEERYANTSKLPIDQQPIGELVAEYESLIASQSMPPNAKQVAEFRVQALKVRAEALKQFETVKQSQASAATKQQDLVAEQVELEQRVAQTNVTRYAAVGRLTVSNLQAGNTTFYRLVDPANSRTVIYVRTNDAKVGPMMDKFVGVKGEVVKDASLNLTYVIPTDFTEVESAQVNQKVFADYLPPSLASKVTGAGN